MWLIVALVFVSALFLASLAAVIYVTFRFLSLVVSMEIGVLREFKGQPTPSQTSPTVAAMSALMGGKLPNTDGEFIPYDDEVAMVNEQAQQLRKKGFDDKELEQFIKQAVSDQNIQMPDKE